MVQFQEMQLNVEETSEQSIETTQTKADMTVFEEELNTASKLSFNEEAKASEETLLHVTTEEESFQDTLAVSTVESDLEVEEATFVSTDQVSELPRQQIEESTLTKSETESQLSQVSEDISEVSSQHVSNVKHETKQEETKVSEEQTEFAEAKKTYVEQFEAPEEVSIAISG